MKKFFSILCALAIVLGVNAASVSKKDFADKKVAKKELRVKNAAVKAPVKAAPFKTLKQTVSVKKVASAKELNAPKHTLAGVDAKKSFAKAPQAKKETVDLTFTSADADIDWQDNCATDGWWQLEAESDEWYVSLSNAGSEVAAGTYAWEDLDPEYCCVYDIVNESGFIYFTDGSCTVTVSEKAVLVAGTFAGEDGNTYNISIAYEAAEVPQGGEFECDNASFSYYSSDNDAWYKLTVEEIDAEFRFDIIVGDTTLDDVIPGKIYTLEDMIANYTYAKVGDAKLAFTEASFVKTLKEDGSGDINAVAIDTLGNTWKLHYAIPATPVAENFETITAPVSYTAEPYLFWTLYSFEAQDAANAIVLELLPDDAIYGTWEAGEDADITGAVTPLNGIKSEIYSGEVTIAATAEGFKITGKVLCWNNTEYTLDLTYVIPDATRQVDFTLAGLEANVFDGGWQLSGFNADETEYITIAALSDEVSGNYTEANLYADYCYIYTGLEFDEEGHLAAGTQFTLLKADLNVTFNEADSTMTITGKFRAQNADDATDIPEFTLALSGKIPAPEVSDMTFEFAESEEGITVTPSNDEDAWDWYLVNEETFEYYGAQYIAEAIYGNYGDQYAVTGEKFLSFEEDLAYYIKGSGVYYLVVWGAGANNITTEAAYYEFEVEAGAGDPYDAKDEDFKFVFPTFAVDTQYLAQYHVLVVDAQDAENHYISLEIASESATLAAGEYKVGEDEVVTPGSVSDYIYGSFAGNKTAQGISVPLWLIVDGTVTVYENGPIAVKATNTWGRQIECLLGTWPEAIDNTDAKATVTKSIKNGQLIIIKNGVEYNAQGAIVK